MRDVAEKQQEQPVETEAPKVEAAKEREELEQRLVELTVEELAELLDKSVERDQFYERMQRMQSEMENIAKRARREKDDWRLQANQNLLGDVLPVLDSFQLALDNSGDGGESFLEGVSNVARQLQAVMERCGVTPIEALEQPFDPSVHEALMSEESADHPDQTVIKVLKPGYKLHDKVLRPAQVSVSRVPQGE